MPESSQTHHCSPNRALAVAGLLLAATACGVPEPAAEGGERLLPLPAGDHDPRQYVCYRAPVAPVVDGRLDEAAWEAAPWSAEFVDIRGPGQPQPRFKTQMRLLWDDERLYVAAHLQEPDVWGTLTERDSVIYHDNDFELFIDPDGDTHDYYELEINALGTEWDLRLRMPYRDAPDDVDPAVDDWDIAGLETGVGIDGTLNDPSDVDYGWNVEIAIPWAALAEHTSSVVPPRPGDRWWMNFSRVEWRVDSPDGVYEKRTDPEGGDPLDEDNWVWSPQGLVAMHYPEMWGRVQFSSIVAGEGEEAFVPDPSSSARQALRRLYYAQRHHEFTHGEWAAALDDLDLAGVDAAAVAPFGWPPDLVAGATGWEASVADAAGTVLTIRHDGRLRAETVAPTQ